MFTTRKQAERAGCDAAWEATKRECRSGRERAQGSAYNEFRARFVVPGLAWSQRWCHAWARGYVKCLAYRKRAEGLVAAAGQRAGKSAAQQREAEKVLRFGEPAPAGSDVSVARGLQIAREFTEVTRGEVALSPRTLATFYPPGAFE